jgi:putative Mg2+ transporter-C (MgtC) family protein
MVMTLNSAAAAAVVTSLSGGQGWRQAGELGLALLLSACIGVEREIRQKNAGLRTHTLVGLGAALFMLVSKYGFSDVVVKGLIVADPSRVAAQIVSGVGFLGAGLIFVRRDAVRGLTTAAAVWVTAAVGAAAGAGLGLLAAEVTAGFLVVTTALPALARRLPRSPANASALLVRYPDGRGVLRQLLQTATSQGFTIGALSARSLADTAAPGPVTRDGRPMVEVSLHVSGQYPVSELAAAFSEIDDVDAVLVGAASLAGE